MRPALGFILLLGLLSTHCGSVQAELEADAGGGESGAGTTSCPHPRLKTDGEWRLLERSTATFSETVVSSDGEDSFRTLSCGVENSARQPSFAWTAPYDGSFSFSFTLPEFSVPAPIIALAVVAGDCAGEELRCKSSPTTRVGFDLELQAGQQVTVLIELDDRVGDSDTDLSLAITDSTAID